MKTIISKQFSLQTRDFVRGLIMAVGTPVLSIVYETLTKEDPVFNWPQLAKIGLAAGVMYLSKNFVEPTKQIKVETKPSDDVSGTK